MSDTLKRTQDFSTKKRELLKKLQQQQGLSSTAPAIPLVPVARGEEELFPLSFAQQRLWLLEQLNPQTPLYNVPLALRFSGSINLDALKHALREVVRRHEVLRTVFIERAGVPFQKIMPATDLPVSLVDLRHLNFEQREQEAQRYAREEAERPFDLASDLLLRATVLQLADDEYVFLMTMHHIVSDAWSVEVFYRELLVHYQAYEEGCPDPLPELSVQYVDYAHWQRQWLQGDLLQSQLSYWEKQLAALPALLPLPTDHQRPAVQTLRGASHTFQLSPRLTAHLKALSQREECTLFMTVLAAFQVWLARHTNLDDIAVGTPIANRSQAELEPLIGFFLNTLVLRTQLAGNPSFRELLQQVREVTLNAFNYREVPFELVVEALQPERNLSYAPLFQVLFTLQNISANTASSQPSAFLIQPFETANTVAKHDLSLGMIEAEVDGELVLRGEFEYSCDLFEAATIARFAQRFITLLEEIVKDPEQHIQELNVLPGSERQQILECWQTSTSEAPQERCFHSLFEAQVERTPAAPALVFGEEQLSYEELNSKANQLAHYLRKRGVKPEVRVGIVMERGLEMVIALLGVLKAGGAYVPIDPATPRERRAFILAELQAPVLVSQSHLRPTLVDDSVPVVCLDGDWETIAREPSCNLTDAISAHNMAYIIYTSGSTGQPKGVVIQHGSMTNLARGLAQSVYAQTPGTPLRVGLNAALTFDASVQQLVQLLYGHTLYILPQEIRSDTAAFLEYLQRHALQIVDCTPGQLRQLLVDGLSEQTAPALSHVLVGGEAIDATLWQALCQDNAHTYYNLYGPTECTVDATTCRIQAAAQRPTIGRPLTNVEVYVLDSSLQPAPIGVPGELYIGGSGLARGYLNRPDLTEERFIPHPFRRQTDARLYRTGDQVRWLADGNLEYLGRLDQQIKIRGFRIEPGEIEQWLLQHPDIHECAVVARQDQIAQSNSLVAYIVPKEGAAPLSRDLRAFLQVHLPAYMLPSSFEILDVLPRTTSGKIDRQALPALYRGRAETLQSGPLPRNPLEEAVAEIWQQVLGLEQVGIREHFFEIGGHSLLAMQVISRIRAVFQIELPLRRLFEAPTIEGLAQVIARARQEEQPLLEPPVIPRAHDFPEVIPISFAQQRLWILDRLNPGSTTYHMPLALRLSGPLNRDALERSLSEIVTRHAILRTSFPILQDTPVQHISPAVERLTLSFTDLKHLPANERVPAALRLIGEEGQRPFDLAHGPLFRAHLIEAEEEEHALLLTLHHIVSDGWSMGIFMRELSALYRAFSAGETSPLAPLPLQYADYAIWQRAWLQGDVLERQLSYWKTQLADAPALLSLPTDHPRSAIQDARGASYRFMLAPTLASALQQIGQQAGATLFMTLLAAFQVFLCRYCNQDDIVVGTPIANRMHQEVEDVIGFFVNTLVLRTDLARNPTFFEAIQRVRQVVLDAMTHQDIPFEQIVEALQPERDLSGSPLFQVMFLLQNAAQERLDLTPLTISELELGQSSAKFDLTLALTQHSEGLEAEFEYNTDLFEQTTIVRMAEHFQILLASLVQAPTQPILSLPLLSPEQYKQSVLDWNATERAYPLDRLVYELIEEQAQLRPAAPALSARGSKMTYGELNSRANQLAHYLRARGIGPGSVVGIYLHRTLEMVVALYATLKAGATYLQFDAALPRERATFMLQEAQAALLITQESLVDRLTPCEVPLLKLDQAEADLRAQPDGNLPKNITPEYPAYIIYTSGSTGKPKGVVIQHKSLLRMIFWYHEAFGVTANDKATQFASLSFDAAVFEIWPCLAKGAELFLVEEEVRLSPTALLPWLAKHSITICFLPTALVDIVLNRTWPAQTQLRLLLTGGDQLHHTPTEEAPFMLINMYGPTENTVVATWAIIPPGKPVEDRLPTIGRAIANTQIYVLSRAGEPQPIGVPGELVLGGQNLALGYLKRPDLTASSFMPDRFSGQAGARLYRTGDIVRYLPDGNLEFLGRGDYQVKIRGFRIELGEIEALLLEYPGVREAIVVVNESVSGEKRLAAYIVPQAGVTLSREKLQRFLKERLPDYMLPAAFSLLDELPQTAHGKIDRQALAARRLITRSAEEKYIAPRDAIELQLAHLWEKLLGTSPIGVTENFFQLGGHSLAGVRLMSQLQRLFGVELPLSTLFQEATIASLATFLRQQEAQLPFTPLVAIQPDGSRPPLFCVHPSGGEVLCYLKLAHYLGTDQPVYGLRAPGPEQEGGASLAEMAATYREALCALQPQGPYFLCGWSMGGVIAFEMARQLEAQGQHVAFLGLFDTFLPPAHHDTDERELLRQLIGDLAGLSNTAFASALAGMPADVDDALQYLLLEAQQAHILPMDADSGYIKRLFAIFKKNIDVLCRYQPEAYAGEISLFRASAFTGDQVEITHGWRQFAAHVTPQSVPGNHYTMMRDPQVETLARLVSACLESHK